MTTTKKRVTALVLAAMMAAVGAFAASATVAASDAQALRHIGHEVDKDMKWIPTNKTLSP